MSSSNPEPKKVYTPEELFAQVELLLDNAVLFAFLHHHHLPTPNDLKRLRQRLWVHLREDDYRRLLTYKQEAELATWLQPVAGN